MPEPVEKSWGEQSYAERRDTRYTPVLLVLAFYVVAIWEEHMPQVLVSIHWLIVFFAIPLAACTVLFLLVRLSPIGRRSARVTSLAELKEWVCSVGLLFAGIFAIAGLPSVIRGDDFALARTVLDFWVLVTGGMLIGGVPGLILVALFLGWDGYQERQRWNRVEDAAKGGEAWARFTLAEAFREGEVRAENPENAYQLYLLAAISGHRKAQAQLGWCLENGYGTETNLEHAEVWYERGKEGRDLP